MKKTEINWPYGAIAIIAALVAVVAAFFAGQPAGSDRDTQEPDKKDTDGKE